MLHNLSEELFYRHFFIIFPLYIDCNQKNGAAIFIMWLYKHYNAELYVVVIHMTLSEKIATEKTKSFLQTWRK